MPALALSDRCRQHRHTLRDSPQESFNWTTSGEAQGSQVLLSRVMIGLFYHAGVKPSPLEGVSL
jgi:hypothetical protein